MGSTYKTECEDQENRGKNTIKDRGEGRKDRHLEMITKRKGALPFTVSRLRRADSDVEHLHV